MKEMISPVFSKEQLVTPEKIQELPKMFFVGPIGAGKSEAASHLESIGFGRYTFSSIIQNTAHNLGGKMDFDRKKLLKFGNTLKHEFGDDFLSELMIRQAILDMNQRDIKGITVDGTRFVVDVEYFKNLGNTKVVWVDAPQEVRYTRRLAQGKEGNITFEQFQTNDTRENPMFAPLHALADIEISNTGQIEELHQKVYDVTVGYFPELSHEKD